jgi:hypothetical protein
MAAGYFLYETVPPVNNADRPYFSITATDDPAIRISGPLLSATERPTLLMTQRLSAHRRGP